MRQLGSLDLGDIKQAVGHLTNRNGGFLDLLGRNRDERVEKMATMLRNSSEADIEEMGVVFGLAMAKAGERSGTRPAPRRFDPVSMWADGVRRMSTFDPRDVWRGLENFSRPSAGGMLASLGRTRAEQVERLTGMVADMSPADMSEMGTVYVLASRRATEEGPQEQAGLRRRTERPRRARGQRSAEWRRERRLAN
jgi:hypothetical protein